MRLALGGKEFDLKPLTLNDWIDAEDLGLDIRKLQKNEVKLKDLRTLVYIVIKKVDSSITPEWVGENLSLENKEVLQSITNFISPKATLTDVAT